ncbi:ribosome maturation factor RimM [Edaphobacter aggregans]|uniref:ribosome maturation factor RimM n=1 Tax=Edaphobacter aggregans TaxID=570835 RepID=UPI000550B8F1|nr:ribosome maturation factor RimM [Edaphobacter aggregans]
MDSSTSSWIVLAHLVRPQGRKGELLADLLTDFPDRFAGREDLFLAPAGFAGPAAEARRIDVTSSWLPVGKNKGRVVLQFAGIDSISDAEALAGLDVVVPSERRIPLDAEAIYVSDLVDCALFDGQTEVGRVTGVEVPSATDGARLAEAAPLLVVESGDGSEILVPFAKAFLESIDLPAKRIVMNLPAGLLDVNR